MGDLIYPLQFKRQFSAPLDIDLVFDTTAERIAYLTNERRYAGQIVFDKQDGLVYSITTNKSAWKDVGRQGDAYYLALSGGSVTGNISASNTLYDADGNSKNWNSNYTSTKNTSANWDSVYSSTKNTSANWDSVYSSTKNTSANWDSVYASVAPTSADWDSVYASVAPTSANWDSVYSSTKNTSANWDSVYSSTKNTSANWDSVYASVAPTSANWDSVYSSNVNTSANWDSVYSSTKNTSANWDSVYSSTKNTSANWDSVYASVAPTSANWDSVYSSTKNTSANWDSVYSSTKNTSANWDSVYSSTKNTSANWDSVYASVAPTSANWDSVYASVAPTSANWDSVYSSNVNTSANWDSVYSSTKNTSANWDSVYSSTKNTSANWDSVYSSYKSNSADYPKFDYLHTNFFHATGGEVHGTSNFYGNVTVHGDLSSSGTQYFANTIFNTTSALSVVNFGKEAALFVSQDGTGDIASFYDADEHIEVLHVGGANSIYPNVGIKTSSPNKDFTVNGEISALSSIYTGDVVYTENYGNSKDWNSTYTSVKTNSADWDSVYTSTKNTSANWDSVYSATKNTSANWDSVYASVAPTSANWDSVYSSTKNTSANWDSVYASVAPTSANWDSVYSSTKNTSANWDSVYTAMKANSAFSTDLTVSLPGGKTFGRYTSGETIPALGKTPIEVIRMAIIQPINPSATLTSSTTIAFNQTAISNVLNFSHIINSLGSVVQSASLEWRRNNTGAWTVLSTSTATPTSYTHTYTDTNFNTQPFNYRYIVTDDVSATITVTKDITPAAYVAPTLSLAVAGASVTSPESNSIREKGNVSSNTSGSITRNSINVALTNYVIQYQADSGSWTDIGTATSISGGSYSISSSNHNPTGNVGASTLSYRIKVIDTYQTTYSSTQTVTFKYIIFYGDSASTPVNSADVRALSNKIFTDGSNPFILNTGTTNNKFTVAMPTTLSITQVLDLDSSSANLTTVYVNNPFAVNDFAANAISYNVYTLSLTVPYSPSHRHQVTRA